MAEVAILLWYLCEDLVFLKLYQNLIDILDFNEEMLFGNIGAISAGMLTADVRI